MNKDKETWKILEDCVSGKLPLDNLVSELEKSRKDKIILKCKSRRKLDEEI